MNDSQLLERLAATDAYAPHLPLSGAGPTREAALTQIEQRANVKTRPESGPPLRSRHWNGWLVAAAAFVVVLVTGAALVLLTAPVNEPAIAPTSTTLPQTPTTASTIPPEPVPPMVESWQRVGGAVMAPVVGTFGMAEAGSRLFVVGFDPGEDNYRQNGVIFASEDGVNWVRLAERDPALNLGAVLMFDVTAGGPGLVAVGMGCENEAEGCAPHATAWTSVDGTSWTRTPEDPAIYGDSATQTSAMAGVAETSHGLVAVGAMEFWTLDEEGVEQSVTIHPAVWTSGDGITWERTWEGAGTVVAPDDYQEVTPSMDAVVEGPDGTLVAVGASLDSAGEPIAAVWLSDDGGSWERVEPNTNVFSPGTVMIEVAHGDSGFVAVGADGPNVGIWRSLDGTTWTRVDTSAGPFDGGGGLSSVAALDGGYVVVGPDPVFNSGSRWVTVWTSPDGATWDRVAHPAEGYATEVVVVDGGIVVSGGLLGTDNFHAAVWAGPRLDPNAPPPELLPPSEPPQSEGTALTGIAAVVAGFSCEEIAAQGFTYAEAVSYWLRYELTDGFDLDTDGVPCAAAYASDEIAGLFGESEALAVQLVSDHPTGTFIATGPAVDAGLVCAAGTIAYTPDPDPTLPRVLWRWEDRYTCDDGSGGFLLGVDEYIDIDGAMYGVWNIVSGTDSYATLGGGGGTDSAFDAFDASFGRLWTAADGS
jgi:hypothetical protein